MKLDQVWDKIRKLGNRSPFPLSGELREILLTKPEIQKAHLDRPFCWLIGPYQQVREIARSLPTDPSLQDKLTALNVRVGRRLTDHPPKVLRKGRDPGIGDWGTANTISVNALIGKRDPKNPGKPMARVSDLYDPVRTYWAARTLEAHHIIEKGILADLHLNKGDLDNNGAPTVLLAAEFHQRLFTSEVAAERNQFKSKLHGAQAHGLLKGIYDQLYSDPVLKSLKEIADIINSVVVDNL
jgi:hypothetical protein